MLFFTKIECTYNFLVISRMKSVCVKGSIESNYEKTLMKMHKKYCLFQFAMYRMLVTNACAQNQMSCQ